MPTSQHLQWNAQALWQELLPLLPGLNVEVLASVDSTNTQLLERARRSNGRRNDDMQPCLLVAETQTQGRGRQGRAWHSSAHRSLTFSLALSLNPPTWSGLSLAVGMALADALDPPEGDAPPRLGLKWPNDLWLLDAPGRGRKLGGILIETLAVGEQRMAVIGIGLNVMPQTAGADLPFGSACLQELQPQIDVPQVLHRVALPLVRALKRFEHEGFAPLARAYARRDLLLGQPVSTTYPGVPEGVAEGIDEQGALRVRAGALHTLVSGEVSVRPKAD